jgi:hypothetical protein
MNVIEKCTNSKCNMNGKTKILPSIGLFLLGAFFKRTVFN